MTTENTKQYWAFLNSLGDNIVGGLTKSGVLNSKDDAVVTDKMASIGFYLSLKAFARKGEHGWETNYDVYTLRYHHPMLRDFEIRVDSGTSQRERVEYDNRANIRERDAPKVIYFYEFTGRNASYDIDKPSWLSQKIDEIATTAWTVGAVVASAFGGPVAGAGVKAAQGLDSGVKIDSAVGGAAKSLVISQLPGVIDNLIFTDGLSAATASDFNISSPSFNSSALTNPTIVDNIPSVDLTMPVSPGSLSITELPALGAPTMDGFTDFDITPDTYSGFTDNVDFSWGEGSTAFSDAQNVSFGFAPQLGESFPTFGDGGYSETLTGGLPSAPAIVYGATPDSLVSDFGSIPYSNPPANGTIFTASNLKVAENIGKTVVNVVKYAQKGGGSKFSVSGANNQPATTASGSLAAQKEQPVKTVGQLQPDRPVPLNIPPFVFVAGGIAGLYFLTKRK